MILFIFFYTNLISKYELRFCRPVPLTGETKIFKIDKINEQTTFSDLAGRCHMPLNSEVKFFGETESTFSGRKYGAKR